MAYCEVAEVRAMIKDDAINAIIGNEYIEDEAEREAKLGLLAQEAVLDACGEIDGYLAKRYPVPLAKPPRAVVKIAKDIAVYNLFARIGIDEDGRDKTYLTRYNAAVAYLRLVAEGKADLDMGGGGAAQTASNQGFKMSTQPRLFSRDRLKGM